MTLVKLNTMRQSTLSTADICLHRLEYYLNPETPKRGSVMRSMGTGYHAGLAHYYGERMSQGFFLPNPRQRVEMLDAAVEAFDDDVDENEFYDWRYQPRGARQEEIVIDRDDAIRGMEKALNDYFNGSHYWEPEYQVVGVEQQFEIPYPDLDGWTVSGTIDLVLENTVALPTEPSLQIDDHKLTRKGWQKKKAEPTNPQAAWYTYAASVIFETPIEDIAFTFSVMGLETGFERWEATRSEREVQATLGRGRYVAELIEQGGPFPPNPSSFLCSEAYCDYWMWCPFGASLNRQ